MNRNEIYTRINNQILAKLKEGTIPWKKSWKEGIPMNFISRKPYHGINFISLCLNDYGSPYYMTFHQCKMKEGSIKRGEKASLIVYYKLIDLGDGDEPVNKQIPFLRYSNVFNLSQTTLEQPENDQNKIIECDKILAQMKDGPVIRNNIRQAFYSPSEDYISIPILGDFDSKEEYYATLFHEAIHATGHKKRLNRLSVAEADQELYCYEELIAELGAAYLCAITGISIKVIDNSAAYIDGWLKLATETDHLFVKAAKDAQKAVDYILGKTQ